MSKYIIEFTEDLLTEFAMKSFNQKRGMAECMAMEFMFERGQVKKDLIAGVVGRSEQLVCYTCNCTKGNAPKGDNFCNMCDHYF